MGNIGIVFAFAMPLGQFCGERSHESRADDIGWIGGLDGGRHRPDGPGHLVDASWGSTPMQRQADPGHVLGARSISRILLSSTEGVNGF